MNEKSFDIQEELKKLPASPGVYLMHDEQDHVIYVGKAIKLRNRVRQYFQSTSKGPKIDQMVRHIRRFEYIVTGSELEALALECNLIKEYHPKYNTMLMDDKSYPYIKVTVQEDFPRVFLTRQLKKDQNRYFGPYTDVTAARDALDLIMKLYRIRRCKRSLPRDIGKERACLQYDIKQCDAPCQGLISKEEYREHVDQVLRFLSGHYDEIEKEIRRKMGESAEALEYEKAAGYKQILDHIESIAQTQRVISGRDEDRDILALAKNEKDAVVQIFFIRGGRLIGRDHYYLQIGQAERSGQIISDFIKQFYSGTPYIPAAVFLPEQVEDQEILEKWLGDKRGHKVTLTVPLKGEKARLVKLAEDNARMILEKDAGRLANEAKRTVGAMEEIKQLLGLQKLNRVEAYDISNISGFSSVGSMVVFQDGKPKNSDYRKFRIKSVQGPDDYASLEEVLRRRLTRGLKQAEGQSVQGFSVLPDLIMMDGGKGQIGAALKVMKDLGLSIPISGMVKDDRHHTRGLYYNGELIPISSDSEGFKLITRIQDEAHRFAITYHRSLRGKKQVHSVLDDIPLIGPNRRKALMNHFADLQALREAGEAEPAAPPAMNAAAATEVYRFFHSDSTQKGD